MEKKYVYIVWATPRDPYTGNPQRPKRLKVYSSMSTVTKFKNDWETDYCKNCEKSSGTYGKSPCWIDYEPKLDIEAVPVED